MNHFLPNAPILHPLKTPENKMLSSVFRGYKTVILAANELKMLYDIICREKDIFYWERWLSSIICFYIYKVLLKWKWI